MGVVARLEKEISQWPHASERLQHSVGEVGPQAEAETAPTSSEAVESDDARNERFPIE